MKNEIKRPEATRDAKGLENPRVSAKNPEVMGAALRRRARVRGRLGLWFALSCAPTACRSGGDAPTAREPSGNSEEQRLILPACGKDQVREYRCDALVPLHSALPAPEPYG